MESITGGKIVVVKTPYEKGETVIYECDRVDFRPFLNSTRTCQNGSRDGFLPTCQQIKGSSIHFHELN